MKILLINNSTKHLPRLRSNLSAHDVEVVSYKPGIELDASGKDLVILSGGGGEGREVSDRYKNGELWYEDEMEFVHSCDKPILGICMGFEIISQAYGGHIKQMPRLIEGHFTVTTTKVGGRLLDRRRFKQFQSHQWQVTSVPTKYFKVLAESETGLEVIRHHHRPIFATQFHPEYLGGSLELKQLIKTAF